MTIPSQHSDKMKFLQRSFTQAFVKVVGPLKYSCEGGEAHYSAQISTPHAGPLRLHPALRSLTSSSYTLVDMRASDGSWNLAPPRLKMSTLAC
jgi:hypothetical protein